VHTRSLELAFHIACSHANRPTHTHTHHFSHTYIPTHTYSTRLLETPTVCSSLMALRRLISSGSSCSSSAGGRMNLNAVVEIRSEEKAELWVRVWVWEWCG
jgi:hypothetical protein